MAEAQKRVDQALLDLSHAIQGVTVASALVTSTLQEVDSAETNLLAVIATHVTRWTAGLPGITGSAPSVSKAL